LAGSETLEMDHHTLVDPKWVVVMSASMRNIRPRKVNRAWSDIIIPEARIEQFCINKVVQICASDCSNQ